MLYDARRDVLRQAAGADRLQHALLQIGERIQNCSDEHVAGHAADGVQVQLHGRLKSRNEG